MQALSLLFTILLHFQVVLTCQTRFLGYIRISPDCSGWVRNGTGPPPNTLLASEVAAKAFLIRKTTGVVGSKEEPSLLHATITNASAMSSVMKEWGASEERGRNVATILKFLETSPELRTWLPGAVPSESLENCTVQVISTAGHIQRVFNSSLALEDRVKDAKLVLHSLEQMLKTFGHSTTDLARTKGASAPYLLSLATIFAVIGRLIVRYERAPCYPRVVDNGRFCHEIRTETGATRVTQKGYVVRIGNNFAVLKKLLNESLEEGIKERLELIQMRKWGDCRYIYNSSKLNGESCEGDLRADPNSSPEFLTGCVSPNAEESDAAKIPIEIGLAPAIFDGGTSSYVCVLQPNCLGMYQYQLRAGYENHFTNVMLNLYLGDKAPVQSTSWNEVLKTKTNIFPALQNVFRKPACDKDGVMQELRTALANSATKKEIYDNYRKNFNKTKFPYDKMKETVFVQTLLANAERNLDYEIGLSSWGSMLNRFTDQR